MGFVDLEKAYDRVNREALTGAGLYDVVGKLLSLAFVRAKGECVFQDR